MDSHVAHQQKQDLKIICRICERAPILSIFLAMPHSAIASVSQTFDLETVIPFHDILAHSKRNVDRNLKEM